VTTRLPGDDATRATPLTDEDLDELIPTFVATRADLNLAEQANIETATLWAFGRRRVAGTDRLLTIDFADRVHRRMFGDVWRWAGQHRTRMTNIGVEPHQITTQMKLLFDDALYWHDHNMYQPAERAVRLHQNIETDGTTRRNYITALQAADRGDIEPLRDFAQR
jgi:Fic-DOC domain mobile mystery protein B